MATLVDPYAYLEDSHDPATAAWTAAENSRTRAYLDALPARASLIERFERLLAIDSIGVPQERGGRLFFVSRRGEQDQTVLAVREGQTERTLLDPVALDPSGLTALDWWSPSPNGTLVAFGLSTNGDERSVLHLLDVARSERFGETIPDTRYCVVAWLPDERGFYYTRYPPGGNYDVRVYYHVLGSPWEHDPLVFGEGRKPEEFLSVALSEDGRRLVVSVHDGWISNDVYVADLTLGEPPRFAPLAEGRRARYDVHVASDRFVVRTNESAPRYRLFEVDPAQLERAAWRELVPERADVLQDVAVALDALVLHYLRDVRSVCELRLPDGRIVPLAELSTFGPDGAAASVVALASRESSKDVYVLRTSFFEAASVERIRVGDAGARIEPVDRVPTPFRVADYVAEQFWCTSKDGTRVPLSVLSHARTRRDGRAPAVLHGYGGFDIALLPGFQASVVPWLDAGGVFAIANLRGGGEFGEEWHRSGMLHAKQNVFDDFVAAAEFLGTSGLADPRRIGIVGGSNGGLLVAAAEVQRPDLFAAVVCAVPLTDMLHFHRFAIARLWISEYGDPDDPDDAAVLRAYSPYHNVRDRVAYPATFVVTAESDSRVDPMHARKFAARLQAATAADAPILCYIEPQAGHGVGKPRHKQVAELADRWGFFMQELGVQSP